MCQDLRQPDNRHCHSVKTEIRWCQNAREYHDGQEANPTNYPAHDYDEECALCRSIAKIAGNYGFGRIFGHNLGVINVAELSLSNH